MSKIALTPNASGTGTLTIAAPNTNADRTLTLPDATGTLATAADITAALAPFTPFTSAETTLSRDGRWTFAHGLGVVPSRVQMNLRCVISERNFSVNDVVYYNSVVFDPNSGFGIQLSADTTNVYLGVYYVYVRDKTTGTGGTSPTWLEITYANWRASVLAWK
jgi:hypothetical protein